MLAAASAIDALMAEARSDRGARAGGQRVAGERSAAERPEGTPARCLIEHAGVVPFGSCVVAVVVVLVTADGWVEQLVGAALVSGDPRQSVVKATLAAVNRRLESLLR
jgi:hypothetical protein